MSAASIGSGLYCLPVPFTRRPTYGDNAFTQLHIYTGYTKSVLYDQATMERQETESRSQKMQLDSECTQLRRQIKDLQETLLKEAQTWENDRTSLSRQLELVCSLLYDPPPYGAH